MALKAILLRHKIEAAEKNLEALRARSGELEKRETELTSALEEATAEGAQTSAEDMAILERDIDAHTQERDAHQQALTAADQELEQLRADLAAEESRPVPAAPAAPNHNNPERSDNTNMNTRTKFFGMTVQERDAFLANEEVKSWLQRVRAMKGQTRAVTGGELIIPVPVVEILREEIEKTSKLMKYLHVRKLKGKGREVVPGTIPEAVWTEMCAKLNELVFEFNAVEVDGYKVGGYVPVCNRHGQGRGVRHWHEDAARYSDPPRDGAGAGQRRSGSAHLQCHPDHRHRRDVLQEPRERLCRRQEQVRRGRPLLGDEP